MILLLLIVEEVNVMKKILTEHEKRFSVRIQDAEGRTTNIYPSFAPIIWSVTSIVHLSQTGY